MIRVLLFARARDLVGSDVAEVPTVATVGDLRRSLVEQYPHLAGLLAKSALAVADEIAGDDTPLTDGTEVALLPPVSGG